MVIVRSRQIVRLPTTTSRYSFWNLQQYIRLTVKFGEQNKNATTYTVNVQKIVVDSIENRRE